MKDRETELLEQWRRERPMYEAWGAYVSETLTSAVAKEIDPVKVDLFFRIPLKHRTKDEGSLLAKAFHRGKPYRNPYEDIEDKVGVRIVVLFSEEIRVVERTILSCNQWTPEKARDFEDERLSRPFEFDYQSVHYVVRSKVSINRLGEEIAANTPCEIQVRTILQHAYSELTHDTIYKPSVQAEADVKRAAAKSMALIEATDDYFAQVRERLEKAQAPGQHVTAVVDRLYPEFTGLNAAPSPFNILLIDHFKQWARDNFQTEISAFLKQKAFLADFIRERASADLLYRQPATLLIYWAVSQAPRAVAADGPLSNDELAPFYGDLGLSFPKARA